ncbi:methyl-accepting chemotaxis protein [Pelovirga terrestris]|uniref:HAMP domain-containing protein n=1 Tax=Pelovirga terrestris TaxID=2771352 RepID=A0A8J6R6Y8_9BACT|nr:methyl-accepting chemotaxis protein [Pelovirga terrestris]MBD1401874.1 HAMP domain-containing protein [Pelovirga terrestris]
MATMKQGLRIRTKLMMMVLLLVFISIFIGGVAFYGVQQTLVQFSNQITDEISLIHSADTTTAKARRYEKEFFLFSSIPKNADVERRQANYLSQMNATFDELLPILGRLGNSGLDQVIDEQSLASRAVAYDLIEALKQDLIIVREAAEPLGTALMAGKTFHQAEAEYAVYRDAIRNLENRIKDAINHLEGMLARQKVASAAYQSNLFNTLILLGGGMILVGIFVGLFVSNRITTPLRNLMQGITAISRGEIVEVEITTSDELAEIAQVFNETMNRIRGYIKTDEQRLATEANVINFLEVVSEAADGDFTLRAPVTEDAFGSIADAYNLMVESLAELLTDTTSKASEVGDESRHLLEIFNKMKEGSNNQLHYVSEAIESADETISSATQIAEKTDLARQSANQVESATSLGNERVNLNIEGMQLIRVTVQVINKKMKSLAERLQEIGTISQLISDVATRTTILAMNASIEASRAGEQGRGFLVISDEIKRLADEASGATRQIGGIIKAIQSEANDVTTALEEETSTVEDQARLVMETGEALAAIKDATDQSKHIVTQITSLSQEQLSVSEKMVNSIRKMADITDSNTGLINESALITEGLSGVSKGLLTSLTRFRLGTDVEADTPVLHLKASND